MATPRTQSVGGWVVLCARSLGGDVGGSPSRPRSREEQGRARLEPRPHRHQAWDDQGLGIRRSGVLLSHARANGVPPLYRA